MDVKLDLYKLHKDEYVTPKTPALVKVKPAKYLTFEGQGAPGGDAFSSAVGALYAVAYTLKMAKKRAGTDYRVCALEGLWWGAQNGVDFLAEPRETWCWKLLIRVPDFIAKRDVTSAIQGLVAKGKSKQLAPQTLAQVQLEKINEGPCVQMLHVGPYATETATIVQMHEFAVTHKLAVHGLHHEIYLSDPSRVKPEKMKTILRLPVRRQKAAKRRVI